MDRNSLREIDFSRIARVIVSKQARVQPGEVVQVHGGIHNRQLIEEVAVEIRKVGGFPLVDLSWESLSARLINEVSDEYLAQEPRYRAKLVAMVDCSIGIAPHEDPRKLACIDPGKSRILGEASRCVQEARVKRGARCIGAGFPTAAQAEMYGLSHERFHELFWQAAEADVEKIFQRCSEVRERLRGSDRVRIVSPEGEELRFSIKGRRINMDDGVISDEDLETGDVTANFPFGEVYCAPLEDTVEGVSLYPVVFYKAQEIRNLRLVFEKGQVVSSSADTNHHLFEEAMSTYTGDKFRLGELGIGTNHEVHVPTGNTLLDEKVFGSIHLAIGENRSYGGVNSSSCHWDMVMLKPTVYLDDEMLLKDGTFV
jgi:leucyl aminopeptidase (aminopeptidase T)